MNEVIRQQELISYDRIPDLAGLQTIYLPQQYIRLV